LSMESDSSLTLSLHRREKNVSSWLYFCGPLFGCNFVQGVTPSRSRDNVFRRLKELDTGGEEYHDMGEAEDEQYEDAVEEVVDGH
jgi:hypothetical protein